jgi:septum formation protein
VTIPPVPDSVAAPPVRLYLASTSPARLATLRAAGIEPVVLPSYVDEDAAVAAAGSLSPSEMVLLLARLKAEAVVGDDIDGFILGGDSAFELDGIVYGKPHRPEIARERWLLQRGRTGHLHSGHWVIDHRSGVRGGSAGSVATAGVTFASDIADAEIDAYIGTGEPLLVAGAFTIDSLGAPFITAVDGDPHAVVGLSLATVRSLLLTFGVSWPSLWNRQTPLPL